MERKEISKLGKVYKHDGKSYWVECALASHRRMMPTLRIRGIRWLSMITGADRKKGIEVIYHFDNDGGTLNLKFRIPRKKAEIGTITRDFPAAEMLERELAEMLGIKVIGHPDPRKLFLCETSPETPLRKNREAAE